MSNFEIFLAAYVEAMLWSSSGTDQNGEELQSLEGFELSSEAKETVNKDCQNFIDQNKNLLCQVYKNADGFSSAGHDFWLTRNHHGAGFWDRGFGFIGDALTDRAQEFKELSPYIGDDGKIYF